MAVRVESIIAPQEEKTRGPQRVGTRKAESLIREIIEAGVNGGTIFELDSEGGRITTFKYANVFSGLHRPLEIKSYLVDKEDIQSVGLKVMKSFGLKEDRYEVDDNSYADDVRKKDRIERRRYPGRSPYVFEREVTYSKRDDRMIDVEWKVWLHPTLPPDRPRKVPSRT